MALGSVRGTDCNIMSFNWWDAADILTRESTTFATLWHQAADKPLKARFQCFINLLKYFDKKFCTDIPKTTVFCLLWMGSRLHGHIRMLSCNRPDDA